MGKKMIVTTSWDDGHKLDIRLAGLLKKYGIKGTFYISPKNREFKKEDLLSDRQITWLSRDFEIGAHTMTHPRLISTSRKEALDEIAGSKKYLEKLLDKEIKCFCYPGGEYNERIIKFVKRSGYCYARTMKKFEFDINKDLFSSGTALETHRNSLVTLPVDFLKILRFFKFNFVESTKSLNWEYLAKKTFDHVEKYGRIYHLWGHSWVIDKSNDWDKVERVLSYISGKPDADYYTNYDLFKTTR